MGAKEAAKIQAKAIAEAQKFVFKNLDPAVISGMATAADVENQKQRAALQAILDPALSQLRYQSQNQLLEQAGQIGQGPQDQLAQQAAMEAMAGGAPTQDLKTRLIDAALTELDAGATLPPDVQAELVQAGLERAGMVTGRAGPTGIGGTLIRQEVGQGALKLQADHQARAQSLIQSASNLEAQRQQILQGLFPALQAKDVSQNSMAQSGLLTSEGLRPEAGLSGSDIANIWLARVGATSQLQQQAGAVRAAGALGAAQAWAPAIGQAIQTVGNSIPSGWFSGGTPTATQRAVDRSLAAGPVYR